MNPNEYISDEALLALIETAEDQGLLSAPRGMKASILEEASLQQRTPRPKPSRQKQFTAYCFRVGLATAASLVLLFSSAPMAKNIQQSAPELNASQRFTQFTDQLEQGYLDFTQRLSQFDFHFNFGGNNHE